MARIHASSSTTQQSNSPAAALVAEPQVASQVQVPVVQPVVAGQPGQSQFPQLQHSRRCYECGEHGHLRRACPRLRGAQLQQSRSCHACGDPRHIVRFCPRASSSFQHQSAHTRIQAPEMARIRASSSTTQQSESPVAARVAEPQVASQVQVLVVQPVVAGQLGIVAQTGSGHSQGGHSGRQGQSQFPQLQHSCGEHGHLRRACPRLRGAQLQQSRSCHACGDPRHI
ncbi:PREDICTED: DNA-binding protein HEXBP-like, partial [Nicotiana attenuata]|uniref:DNA-binding protein HEXBP-like n=1 Tax=Nicotiana attenuata TaxID=49451 RepID=UPI000904DCF1